MHIAPEKCKRKLGNERLIPGKFLKSTFHTAARWHSFTSEVYPTGIQHQIVFHRLFCTQGRMGWIILVLLEVPEEKGYYSGSEDCGSLGSPTQHDLATHYKSHFHATFYSYYWGRSTNGKSQEGQKKYW